MFLLVTMCADMLHLGHIRLLERAKRLAEQNGLLLLVGLHNDGTISSYKRHPILTQNEREPVVSAIRYVDKVVLDTPLTITRQFMEENSIELVLHAHDEGDTSYDADHEYPISVGKFVRIDYTRGISTTDIINRCRDHDRCSESK